MKEKFRLHGANPEKLYSLFGLQMPDRVFDFSTNTNAAEQRKGFSPDISFLLEDYPDDECLALTSLLSEKEGISQKNIIVTSGSNESIYLIASYESQRENRILQPVYGEYMRALDSFSSHVINIFELSSVNIPSNGTVWLCNPCNPTGAFIPDTDIRDLAERYPDTLFVVDEAYRDFIWSDELRLPCYILPNVIRLRSLTKTYNLCGARIGYAIAAASVIERLKKRQPSWSVSSFAQQAALFFLDDKTLPERTRDYYASEMPRFIGAIRDIGFIVRPTSVNFFLMETDDDEKLIRFLLKRGIVVRHTRNFPGLDGKYVRIAARSRKENDLLIDALRNYN